MSTVAWRWIWPSVEAELLVSSHVATLLGDWRQLGRDVERGGQLFVNPSNPLGLVLELATPPHQADRADRNWLELDSERCRKEVEAANAIGLRLVGYWHSHPQSCPSISPNDIKSFLKFATRNAQELPNPIAIIIGQSLQPEGIKAWSFRDGRYIEALRTVAFADSDQLSS